MSNICSDKPPTNPHDGDMWCNSLDNEIYVFDHDKNRWITYNNDDVVINIIPHDDNDPIENYNRAMGVL